MDDDASSFDYGLEKISGTPMNAIETSNATKISYLYRVWRVRSIFQKSRNDNYSSS